MNIEDHRRDVLHNLRGYLVRKSKGKERQGEEIANEAISLLIEVFDDFGEIMDNDNGKAFWQFMAKRLENAKV